MAEPVGSADCPEREPEPKLILGEVHTCVLPHRWELTGRAAVDLLRTRADDVARLSERPNRYARSPDVLTGVDCHLPSASGLGTRGIGTVSSWATVTEGRLLQAGALCGVAAEGPGRRRPWGHRLRRPGVIEPYGRPAEQDVAAGWLGTERRPGDLDLTAIAARTLTRVLRDPALDGQPPFAAGVTRLRWVALRADDGEAARLEQFTLAEKGLRTTTLQVPPGVRADAVAAFCHDLALHDWLLTTLLAMVERSELGSAQGRGVLTALRPAVDHVMHLWMPAARVDRSLHRLWDDVEHEPGFTRQWQNMVRRIRDQLALHAAAGLLP
ncbi:SCO2521 family protein [Streptomyces zhihengii]|uniref:SCO2521 family protein n=1 Tax=Streptomyces zhihengii TaxID=1818004 RepID=UPI00339F92AC